MSSTLKANAQNAPDHVAPMADSSSAKGVTISDEPERLEYFAESPALMAQSPRMRRASISGKKMTGRPALHHNSSTTSLTGQLASFRLDPADPSDGQTPDGNENASLAHQVMQWLQDERGRRKGAPTKSGEQKAKGQSTVDPEKAASARATEEHDLALDKLERILARYASSGFSSKPLRRQSSSYFRRGSVAKKFLPSSIATSDTDGGDNVATVPHVETTLDNSKALAYTVGGPPDVDTSETANRKSRKHWESFKQDAIRILHTLNLRGWRRLPIELAKHVYIERLSGALTNAVYVVKPPKDIEMFNYTDENGEVIKQKRLPKPLLLRIYGPQTGDLIDRESELMILRRLAAKNIGPRLLGYFTNGRFEEFLHAKTLTPQDLRDVATSKQLAKRMKELHEGIELLQSERAGGPHVFLSWDRWVDRVEKVITWLDQQVYDAACNKKAPDSRYTRRGLICGVEWPKFRKAYEDYRRKLTEEYGGSSKIRQDLVFAHNDTQYGNLLRLVPDDKSPLLQPVNHHKQLVVIDFEYANANTIGLEFANHFTEWCYNYHHPERSWFCNTSIYPTPEEQHRFVRAYVMHRPQFVASASSTPLMEPKEKTNIPDFMLDARAPGGGYGWDYDSEEKAREQAQEHEIQKLLHQTRLWRIANAAFWVAWGIIQAKIPELEETPKGTPLQKVLDKVKSKLHPQSDPVDEEVKEIQEESKHDRPEGRSQEEAHHEGDENKDDDDGFDYLAYSQDRAMFFWGDCVQMGIVKEEDLPQDMLPHIKYVKY